MAKVSDFKMNEGELQNSKEKNNSMKEEINEDILNLIDQLTMHGLPNVFRAKYKVMAFAWLSVFMLSSAFCVWMIVESIMEYFEYNVVTKIRIQSEIPLILPALTICNINPFITEDAFNFVQSVLNENAIFDVRNSSLMEMIARYENHQIIMNIVYTAYLVKTVTKSNIRNETSRKSLGYSFEKFLISCIISSNKCDPNDFVWYFDSQYGNCFIYNSGRYSNGTKAPLKAIQNQGRTNGIQLELFVGNPKSKNSLSTDTGVHVFIHNQSIVPNPYTGLNFPTGFASSIALNKITNNRFPYPYSSCRNDLDSFDSELYKFLIKSGQSYTRINCYNLCIQEEVISKCNCYDTNIPQLKNVSACSSFEKLDCLVKAYFNFVKNIEKSCESKCPLECDSVSYTTIISSSKYPSKSYGEYLLKDPKMLARFDNSSNLTLADLSENILALNFYVETFEQTEITEIRSQTLIGLISSVGGIPVNHSVYFFSF
jgi:hypothetical protein